MTTSSEKTSSEKDSHAAAHAAAKKSVMKDALDLVLCTAAVYTCFLVYGVVQENLYASTYGPNKEKFTFSLFLVFAQCMANGVLGGLLVLVKKQPESHVPWQKFMQVSMSYIGAMFSSNLALNYVSYPTQALAKSCKVIPVMLMRIVVSGKRYQKREYFNVALITAGIAVFMWKESKAPVAGDAGVGSTMFWFGMGLLFLSLVLDGFTGPYQDKMIHDYKPSQEQLMLLMNVWASALLLVVMLLTNELMPALDFIQRFPEVGWEMVLYSVCSALGQHFILVTLFRFNSLVLTIVTTTRKFFTILASVVWFGHDLSSRQWIGVALVFTGLGLDIVQKYLQRVKHHRSIVHHGKVE